MRAYDNNVRADRFLDEHKKSSKNGNLQKILLITCKNSSRKPLKSRVPRGYRRNESKPVEGIDTFFHLSKYNQYERRNESKPVEGIDTLLCDILLWYTVEMKVSPLRALTPCIHVLYHSGCEE